MTFWLKNLLASTIFLIHGLSDRVISTNIVFKTKHIVSIRNKTSVSLMMRVSSLAAGIWPIPSISTFVKLSFPKIDQRD
uniref:YGL027 protein n=1 Tax=Saccharomyces cerevisiae TaxID=4932 RepID=E9P9X9_YEASX|nr:Unknown [Saccharomyces cerevisiae]